MGDTWDEMLGQALDLIRALRAEGLGDRAADLLAAMTSGCTAPELAIALREEALALGEGLPEPVEAHRRRLLLALREVIG